MAVLKGFREFISRGNAVDLAIAVAVGAAFTGIVTALSTGLIDPLIAVIFGQPDLSSLWAFHIRDTLFQPGLILGAIIQFLVVAAALYFMVVVPMNAFHKRFSGKKEEPVDEPSREEQLLSEIRDLLRERR